MIFLFLSSAAVAYVLWVLYEIFKPLIIAFGRPVSVLCLIFIIPYVLLMSIYYYEQPDLNMFPKFILFFSLGIFSFASVGFLIEQPWLGVWVFINNLFFNTMLFVIVKSIYSLH